MHEDPNEQTKEAEDQTSTDSLTSFESDLNDALEQSINATSEENQ